MKIDWSCFVDVVVFSFKNVDVALFSAGGSISKKFGPIAADSGCIVLWPVL